MGRCIKDNCPEDHKFYSAISIMSPYDIIKEFMFKHGFIELKYRLAGDEPEPYYTAKSIAYEKMDEDEFQQVGDVVAFEASQILGISEMEFKRNYKETKNEEKN